MTAPQNAKTSGPLTRDDFVTTLTSKHPVSAEFLQAIQPTIDAIFRNVPEHLRRPMMNITADSFKRQSELELRRMNAGVTFRQLSDEDQLLASRRSPRVKHYVPSPLPAGKACKVR